MITPAYSPTATERVLPRLALDFTTAALDSRVTVTRALNTATRINSSGLIETVNANLPRFDYTLNTGGACKGLLIEEARTNSVLYSADISNAVWTTVYGSFTLTGSQTDPSGGTTATILTGAGGFAQLIVGLLPNTTYTYSFYAKSVSGTPSYRIVSGGGTNLVARTSYAGQINASTWTRVSVTYTTGAADTSVRVYPMDIGSTSAVVLAFHQNEAGAFATSYISTTATSVTRNADVVQMTGTNFSDWYNASEGAFLAKFSFPVIPPSQFRYVLAANDGTATNFISIAGNTTSNVPAGRVIAGGVTQASMGGGAITANTPAIGVLAYKLDSFAYSQNGATTGTDASGTVPTVNRLDIGALTTSYANCHIQRISYWPQRITNSETLAFSK